MLASLLDRVASQMAVRFGLLLQNGFVIDAGVAEFKSAFSSWNVRLDVLNAGNLGQRASDRGGTAASVHVRNFETDVSSGGLIATRCLSRCWGIATGRGCSNRRRRPVAPDQRQYGELNE